MPEHISPRPARRMKLDDATQELLTDGVMTIEEACVFLKVSRRKMYDLMDHPRGFPTVRIVGSRRIPKRAVIEYLARNLQ